MPTPWATRAAAQRLDEERRTPLDLVDPMHPALHRAVDPVVEFGTEALDVLVHQLYATLKISNGLAIAAPQCGVPLALVVVEDGDHGNVFCNPQIQAGGPLIRGAERCLSLPGKAFAVPRHKYTVVVGQDIEGDPFGADVEGLAARMWQHEMDHLEGRLLVGRYPEVKA